MSYLHSYKLIYFQCLLGLQDKVWILAFRYIVVL
jgi:hypothetical protein